MDYRIYIFRDNELVVDIPDFLHDKVAYYIDEDRADRKNQFARQGRDYTPAKYSVLRGCRMDTIPYPNRRRLSLCNVSAAEMDFKRMEPLRYFAIRQGVELMGQFETRDLAVKFIRKQQKEEQKKHQWLHGEFELIAGDIREWRLPDSFADT